MAFGDLGRGSWDDGVSFYEYGVNSKATAIRLAADVDQGLAAFIHHFGDISYAVGYLQTWDEVRVCRRGGMRAFFPAAVPSQRMFVLKICETFFFFFVLCLLRSWL